MSESNNYQNMSGKRSKKQFFKGDKSDEENETRSDSNSSESDSDSPPKKVSRLENEKKKSVGVESDESRSGSSSSSSSSSSSGSSSSSDSSSNSESCESGSDNAVNARSRSSSNSVSKSNASSEFDDTDATRLMILQMGNKQLSCRELPPHCHEIIDENDFSIVADYVKCKAQSLTKIGELESNQESSYQKCPTNNQSNPINTKECKYDCLKVYLNQFKPDFDELTLIFETIKATINENKDNEISDMPNEIMAIISIFALGKIVRCYAARCGETFLVTKSEYSENNYCILTIDESLIDQCGSTQCKKRLKRLFSSQANNNKKNKNNKKNNSGNNNSNNNNDNYNNDNKLLLYCCANRREVGHCNVCHKGGHLDYFENDCSICSKYFCNSGDCLAPPCKNCGHECINQICYICKDDSYSANGLHILFWGGTCLTDYCNNYCCQVCGVVENDGHVFCSSKCLNRYYGYDDDDDDDDDDE